MTSACCSAEPACLPPLLAAPETSGAWNRLPRHNLIETGSVWGSLHKLFVPHQNQPINQHKTKTKTQKTKKQRNYYSKASRKYYLQFVESILCPYFVQHWLDGVDILTANESALLPVSAVLRSLLLQYEWTAPVDAFSHTLGCCLCSVSLHKLYSQCMLAPGTTQQNTAEGCQGDWRKCVCMMLLFHRSPYFG